MKTSAHRLILIILLLSFVTSPGWTEERSSSEGRFDQEKLETGFWDIANNRLKRYHFEFDNGGHEAVKEFIHNGVIQLTARIREIDKTEKSIGDKAAAKKATVDAVGEKFAVFIQVMIYQSDEHEKSKVLTKGLFLKVKNFFCPGFWPFC